MTTAQLIRNYQKLGYRLIEHLEDIAVMEKQMKSSRIRQYIEKGATIKTVRV